MIQGHHCRFAQQVSYFIDAVLGYGYVSVFSAVHFVLLHTRCIHIRVNLIQSFDASLLVFLDLHPSFCLQGISEGLVFFAALFLTSEM
jgi:hypothetical protein